MRGLDTSVVLRLLVGEPHDQAEIARRRLDEGAPGLPSASISDLVVAESYFALRHHYAVPHAAAISSLGALLADPRVRSSGIAEAILGGIGRSDTPPGLIDRLIHADYGRTGAILLTFDRRAALLEHAELLET